MIMKFKGIMIKVTLLIEIVRFKIKR
jgi:hypothetical protein